MKKILMLLFLMPNLVMAWEKEIEGTDCIERYDTALVIDCENLPYKTGGGYDPKMEQQKKEIAAIWERLNKEAEQKESDCIDESAKALNDFAAKKIFKRCMRKN